MPGSGPEYDFCELPTIRQLTAMRQLPGNLGWNYLEANPFAPTPEERDSYHDVLLLNGVFVATDVVGKCATNASAGVLQA